MCSNNKHTIEELKSYIEKYLYEGLTYRVLKEKYGDNEIIAFKLSHHNNNALVNDTVMQIKDLILPTKTLLHSDRGFNIHQGELLKEKCIG